MAELPLRPKNDEQFKLPKIDKMIVVSAVLLRLDNQTAFLHYHPEYASQQGRLSDTGKVASRQFWGYGKVKDFREAYEETLQEFLNGKSIKKSDTTNIDDSRKDRALKSLLNQAMGMVEGGADLDADTLKTITEIFKKLNILKDDVEQQEAPRRYLPCRCHQECQYRLFVEQGIENGEIENECLHCKALAFAQERGYVYDPTKNLNIPIKERE